MKLYRKSIGWPFSQLRALLSAVTGPSACYRPRQRVEARRRKILRINDRIPGGIGGISYLSGIYTGVGGQGKLGAQTRAEMEMGGEPY